MLHAIRPHPMTTELCETETCAVVFQFLGENSAETKHECLSRRRHQWHFWREHARTGQKFCGEHIPSIIVLKYVKRTGFLECAKHNEPFP